MTFPHHRIWVPELKPENYEISASYAASTNVHVLSTGAATMDQPFKFADFCGLDFASWPFDTQKCSFVAEKDHELALTLEQNNWNDPNLVTTEWKLQALTFGLEEMLNHPNETSVMITVLVSRRAGNYTMTLFTPITVIVLLTLLGFWLPVQAGEKILLNGIVGLLVNLYMLYFADRIPKMGVNTPLVVRFCCVTLYLTISSMIISILVLALSRTKHNYGTPWIIKRMVESSVGQFLLFNWLLTAPNEGSDRPASFDIRIGREIRPDDEEEGMSFEEDDQGDYAEVVDPLPSPSNRVSMQSVGKLRTVVQQDWISLATLVDRIAFIVYSLIFASLAIIYNV